MLKWLTENDTEILIVGEDAALSSVLCTALKQCGFSRISSVEKYQEAWAQSLTKNFQWIIGTINEEQDYHAMNYLKELSEESQINNQFMSLIVTQPQQGCVPLAFQNGLLSWHDIQSPDSAVFEFTQLKEIAEKNKHCDIKTAADYLRKFLQIKKEFNSLAFLEEQLINLYPSEPKLLLNLAFAYFKNNAFEPAKTLCRQAAFLTPSLKPHCNKILNNIETKIDSQKEEFNFDLTNFYGINSCLVVDPDIAVTNKIAEMLQALDIPNAVCLNDGPEAWEWLKNNDEPDLIIMEWRIPQLSGPALIQRIRSHRYLKTKILLISSLITKSDLPLLNEMFVSNVIMKPVNKADFLLAIRWSLSQVKLPTEQKSLEKQINQALETKDWAKAKALKAAFIANSKISYGRKCLVESRFQYAKGAYKDAKLKVIEALKHSTHEPLDAISLLGKCLLMNNEKKLALDCFEKAQKISPLNIRRLCDIANLLIDEDELDQAKDHIIKAENMDAKNDHVLATRFRHAVKSDSIELAKELIQMTQSKKMLIGLMNNKAISQIHAGHMDRGIEQYKTILEIIPNEDSDLKAIVSFNLGLGFARTGLLDLSQYSLEDSIDFHAEIVEQRAKSLLKRVKYAIRNLTPVRLYTDDDKKEELAEIEFASIAYENVSRPDFGGQFGKSKRHHHALLRIFVPQEDFDTFAKKVA